MTFNGISISDLENQISEKMYIKVQNWNLYLGDAGLARQLAIECISNRDLASPDAARKSIESISVKIGDGDDVIPLKQFLSSDQIFELQEILEEIN